MDKKYIELFKELARATATSAEQVMEYDKEKEDEKGFETAQTMRNDFEALYDKINDGYQMAKNDAARLLVGTLIQIQQMEDKINVMQKAINGYKKDIIPKLNAVIDAEDDESAVKIAEEKFIIEDNK